MLKSLLCVHLLDDFSGSAKVFATAVSVLQRAGHATRVLVGDHGEQGFIRQQHPAETVPYRFHSSRIRLLLHFARVQFALFFRVRKLLRTGDFDAVYVNTVLPAGAMLAARLCRRPVVTHIHEVGLGNATLFRLLLAITLKTSTRLIAVSDYVRQRLQLPEGRTAVVHNSLEPAEWDTATRIAESRAKRQPTTPFRVLMACSLKWYKGVDHFVALARHCRSSERAALNGVAFTLILNCDEQEFEAFRTRMMEDVNIELVRRPKSVYTHYEHAHLVLNLSVPEGWIETFGLTLLEAMACGVPVVSPTVGGCTELFEPGQGGWRIDAHDTPRLAAFVEQLASDRHTWATASAAATAAAVGFSPMRFAEGLARSFAIP